MGFEDTLVEIFGVADPDTYGKAIDFVYGLSECGIITLKESDRIITEIDEIQDMKG